MLGLRYRLVSNFHSLGETEQNSASEEQNQRKIGFFADKISYAFQLATAQGPLCNEPMQGVAVFVENMEVASAADDDLGRLTGEVIRSVRDAIWQGFLDWSPRLLLAMYSSEIQASG